MKRISREEVSKVAQLARLKLNEEQIDNHAIQIAKILEYINQLEKIDTTKKILLHFLEFLQTTS